MSHFVTMSLIWILTSFLDLDYFGHQPLRGCLHQFWCYINASYVLTYLWRSNPHKGACLGLDTNMKIKNYSSVSIVTNTKSFCLSEGFSQ